MADQFALTADETAQLVAQDSQIRALRDALAKMKRIGIDVSTEEAELARLETIRKGLLREFGGSTARTARRAGS